MGQISAPTKQDLIELFTAKYGAPQDLQWSPAQRWRFQHFNPDDVYEALVKQLVTKDTMWLDVGCGRNVFPSNAGLARALADRCKLLVGVDPDETLDENPFVHEKVRSTMDDFRDSRQFNLITLRMVAEHVEDPSALIRSLHRAMAPGGLAAIYTVNKYSPVPLVTNLAPFGVHNPVKKILWGTEERDTFPTCFKMNTRATLRQLFHDQGFEEALFMRLDDCRTFTSFKYLAYGELTVQRILRSVGVPYPEYCLLGVYEKSP